MPTPFYRLIDDKNRIGGTLTGTQCEKNVSKLCGYSFFNLSIFKKHSVLTSAERMTALVCITVGTIYSFDLRRNINYNVTI